MFSGIIEVTSALLEKTEKAREATIIIARPSSFNDIKRGDSIAVNGVCLTLEEFDQQKMQFTLGQETLKVIGPLLNTFWSHKFNLERSLQVGDRLHGHFVQGHVDTYSEVVSIDSSSDSWVYQFTIPSGFNSHIWKKGSVALNGVSLTVNDVKNNQFEVCLIPETLTRTNLSALKVGDRVTFEVDFFARGVVETIKNMQVTK